MKIAHIQMDTKVASSATVLSGTVVAVKMKDTIVVEVVRFVEVQKYGKYVKRGKRYKVHDPGNSKKVGEKVRIVACRPISKEKRFRILRSEQRE